MNTKEFKFLKDCLMHAAGTDNDAEAVVFFRRATLLLATHGYTWAQAMDKRVNVINEVEADQFDEPNAPHPVNEQRTPDGGPARGEPREGGARSTSAKPSHDLDRLFEDAMAGASGSFLETLESIHSQYEEEGWISDRQREVVEDAAERYAERHSGGRVR